MFGPAAARALDNAVGSVAPTTRPSRGGSSSTLLSGDDGVVDAAFWDQSLERVAIFS